MAKGTKKDRASFSVAHIGCGVYTSIFWKSMDNPIIVLETRKRLLHDDTGQPLQII
ncbi:MAG: hypothetical protein H6Q14_1445 [Bacteroidetes bacterium]|jgi:hypothetical protein|nr:hypothetical protein [Bacteroidota bacterium]